jgi:hypothetical protein
MHAFCSCTRLQDPSLRYAFRVVSPEKEYVLQVSNSGHGPKLRLRMGCCWSDSLLLHLGDFVTFDQQARLRGLRTVAGGERGGAAGVDADAAGGGAEGMRAWAAWQRGGGP